MCVESIVEILLDSGALVNVKNRKHQLPTHLTHNLHILSRLTTAAQHQTLTLVLSEQQTQIQTQRRLRTVNSYSGVSHSHSSRLAVWCSSNALVSINAVALHRARLVLGWVTAFGQVNCLTT